MTTNAKTCKHDMGPLLLFFFKQKYNKSFILGTTMKRV